MRGPSRKVRSSTRKISSKQFASLRRRCYELTQRLSQSERGVWGVIARVVVKDDMYLLRLARELLRPLGHLRDFSIRIIVIETRCDRLAGQVTFRVASVHTVIRKAWS